MFVIPQLSNDLFVTISLTQNQSNNLSCILYQNILSSEWFEIYHYDFTLKSLPTLSNICFSDYNNFQRFQRQFHHPTAVNTRYAHQSTMPSSSPNYICRCECYNQLVEQMWHMWRGQKFNSSEITSNEWTLHSIGQDVVNGSGQLIPWDGLWTINIEVNLIVLYSGMVLMKTFYIYSYTMSQLCDFIWRRMTV